VQACTFGTDLATTHDFRQPEKELTYGGYFMNAISVRHPAILRMAAAALFLPLSLSAVPVLAAESSPAPVKIEISNKKSLVHMGSVDSTALTEDGMQAAKLLLDYLENKNIKSARSAYDIYTKIIPRENYGGDYTALQWIIEYLLAPKDQQDKFIANKYDQSFYEFFSGGDFAQLKEYLKRKYKLGNLQDKDPGEGIKRRAFLEDFILFNNPRREGWEKSSEMVKSLGLKPGDKVADIGSGPGYFSFKFSNLVGDKGRVYAIDTVKEHLAYIDSFNSKNGIKNIKTVLTEDNTIGMKGEQVDVAWMCSLYHIIYVAFTERAKDEFVESIKNALKEDGILYVADNGLVPDGVLPYHAPYIDKNLLIGQFQAYGFRLIKEYQFIPQRYILAFKKALPQD
jgi:ubiquinone/menaquinone biosynthesis C-methylase UbiE